MVRALFELLFMIAIALVARAVLNSIFRSIAKNSAAAFRSPSQPGNSNPDQGRRSNSSSGAQTGGELHKDPVCGTYVAASSLRRQVGGQTFYYCSEGCREKHSLVAR